MTTYYIGADVHCNSTEIAIEANRRIQARYTVPTTIADIRRVLDSIQGVKCLTFEESTLAGWLSAWERPLVIEVDELIPRGDRILAMVRWRGRGKGSGVKMEAGGAHLWTFRDGLVVRFDVYRDREEARAALG